MRKRYQYISGILIVALSLYAGLANAGKEMFADFAQRVEAERVKWGAPGLAIAVVHRNEVVFKQGFGVRSLATGEPVNTDTLFHVGSTTKAFITAALGILVEEGKLEWDDRVIDHLPTFRVADPYVTRELTIIDILSHRSGVQATDLAWFSGMQPGEVLSRLAYAKQSTSLRSKWEYNNGMYIVAGEVIEAITGQPFETFVRERLFKPLGMNRTTGPIAEVARRKNVAVSHAKIDGKMTPIGFTDRYDPGAAGLFYSSVSEYANWLRMWLNQGKSANGKRIISEDTVKMAFTPHMVVGEDDIYPAAKEAGVDIFSYGLAWFLQTYKNQRVNMHTGSLDGMSAIVGLMPDQDLGVVVFINGDHIELRHALMYEVFDRVLGGDTRDWSSHLKNLFDQKHRAAEEVEQKYLATLDLNAESALPLERYAGIYKDPLFGEFRVEKNGGNLVLHGGSLLSFDLKPAGAHKFMAYPRDRYMSPFVVPFSVGADNKPDALTFWGSKIKR